MTCRECQTYLTRARIINGLDYCLKCRPKQDIYIHGLLSHANPYEPRETKAFLEDCETRRVADDGIHSERYKPGKRFIWM